MRRFGKFELKIISALLVTAAAPLVFTWLMIDRLVEESMAVGLNEQVLSSLRSGVYLYKEVIESRMKIARLQGAHLADEPVFRQAAQRGDDDGVRSRLEDLVAGTSWISRARLVCRGDEWMQVSSPVSFPPSRWRSKQDRWPVGDNLELEVTFVIAEDFLAASGEMRDLLLTLENLHTNFQPWKMGYYRLFLYIYLFILFAAVVLGFLLARSVTKRIAQVVKATKLASGGDLAVRVGFRSRDEIGSLAESFDQMMDDIQSSRDRIVYLEKISSWQEIARRLAHEIKNPLTPIQLAIQELHRTYRDEDPAFRRKLDDSLEIVEEEVGTLRRMVETFSEFARMPSVSSEPADLNAFVSDYLKLHPQYGGRVELKPAAGPVPVALDRVLMGRVLSNLIDNGLDASDVSAQVTLLVSRVAGWGMISVVDRGSGLTDEAREHLFQPYFTSKAHGTGLGLAIVKKIVLQHGGEIAVSDGEGSGTIFTVRLRTVHSANRVEADGG